MTGHEQRVERFSSEFELVSLICTPDVVRVRDASTVLDNAGIPYMQNHNESSLSSGEIELLVPSDYVETAMNAIESPDNDPKVFHAAMLPDWVERFILFVFVSYIVVFMFVLLVTTGLFMLGVIAVMALLARYLLALVSGISYCSRLKQLGYEWPTIRDARIIRARFGKLAYKVPPAADVEVLPGISRSREGLIQFMMILRMYKISRRNNH